MDASPPPPQPLSSLHVASSDSTSQNDTASTAHDLRHTCSPTSRNAPMSAVDGGKSATITNRKKKKKEKKAPVDVSDQPHPAVSASSSCCTSSFPTRRGVRVSGTRRNPRVLIGSARQEEGDVEALALPLGMSIAAFVAQILERKDAAHEQMSVDHLSTICSLAVRESLVNVFGDKFNCFARNFEKSFRSTLMTLSLISGSSQNNGGEYRECMKKECCYGLGQSMSLDMKEDSTCNSSLLDCQSEALLHQVSVHEQPCTLEETEQKTPTNLMTRQLVLHDGYLNQQLARVSASTPASSNNQSMLATLEKSVIEQTRCNDLKTFEISLIMKKLQMKETQLAINSDLNFLERCKLSMGASKASFKAEKYKNQLEDTRYAELLKTCIDCLVAGLLIMLGSLTYGTYVYSRQRIVEATSFCMPAKDSNFWWMPKVMTSFNSGWHVLRCQVQVVSRMLFGALMILAIAYLLLQRSAASKQTMPITFILLLLGFGCGFFGKLCIDTLGGSGYHWLFYWEVLCLLHFLSNICTSTVFLFLYGPITVTQNVKGSTIFPYWIRRFLYYSTLLLFLPLLCGLIPFASPGEWRVHFSSLVVNLLLD